MNKFEKEKYALAVGESDLKRMTLLGDIYMPYCADFLIENGLKPGMKVADIGCGPGNTTLWLAEQVSETGKVLGVDNSAEQLSILNERILKNKIKNIFIRQEDIYEIDQLDEKFDLVFCRFLFIHLTNPVLAIKKLHALLKPGGCLVMAELENSTWDSYPKNNGLKRDTELLCEVGRQKGADFSVGPKLYGYLRKENFTDINVKIVQPILEGDHRNYLLLKSQAWSKAYFEYHLITPDEMKNTIEELHSMVNNPEYLIFGAKMFLTCAKNY